MAGDKCFTVKNQNNASTPQQGLTEMGARRAVVEKKNLRVKEEAVFGPFNFALLMVAQRRGEMKSKMGSPQDGQREKGNCSCFI